MHCSLPKTPPPKAAADAILSLDRTAFESAEDVSTLMQCLPSEDERSTLQAYVASGKPVEVLSEAERFVLSLMAAPRAATRLRAFSMRFVMAEKHAEAAAVFTDHAKAARELVNSRTLRLALSVALAAGNFLNHGSRLGAAAGFRLKSLNKLADSRSGDGKSTLLQAVAREVCARLRAEDGKGEGSEVGLLVDELPHVVSSRLKSSLQEAGEGLGQ
ncbi:Formin-like protein 18, partial [Monoraphidium neglectum]